MPRYTRRTTPWPENRRKALCEWLRANGVDPNNVPQDADLYLEDAPEDDPYTGRYLHYEAFHLTADGHKHVDERGYEAAVERRTTPLLVDPPDWWQPYRKPTRDQLLDAITRLHALHRQNENTGDCEHCSARDYPNYEVPWPCPTIRALGEEVTP